MGIRSPPGGTQQAVPDLWRRTAICQRPWFSCRTSEVCLQFSRNPADCKGFSRSDPPEGGGAHRGESRQGNRPRRPVAMPTPPQPEGPSAEAGLSKGSLAAGAIGQGEEGGLASPFRWGCELGRRVWAFVGGLANRRFLPWSVGYWELVGKPALWLGAGRASCRGESSGGFFAVRFDGGSVGAEGPAGGVGKGGVAGSWPRLQTPPLAKGQSPAKGHR